MSSAGAQTRKVVTVVFADLAGSTSLQEHLDPESVRHMMDGFYGALRAAVEAHGGTTVKLTGDGLMAGFGVQAVAEDDAWRAVQAAAAMQQAFTQLGWDPSVALRVGVNTGEVIVTEGESDVVGDAVNVAARLEAAAGPGGVLVGEETWRVTRHLARFEAVPALTLRGKADPVSPYRLLGVADAVVEAGGPFVGREDELGRLTALFDEIQQSGVVRLGTVVGSPGLGKSRLAAELVGTLSDRATVLEARFSATSAASTLAPIVDALRHALSDDAAGDVLSASPQTAFLAVRRAIETLAQERPVVLVLEDLHWAEPLALDLVEHLVEWTAAPVLLLGLARPELRELRSSLVDTSGRAAVVTVLEGLDPVASERLACDLLETNELPPALVARILEGSEGNPLFVRELVRMLVDDGVLQLHGQAWRPTIEVDAITVPPTIQSLLAARVERLAADERTVLECAAIVGREFYRGAVAALVPGTVRADLDRILERLRQKEMVEPDGTYWLDEPVLRFHHVLLRDAAYRRLLKEVRAELHERHAAWLEAKVGGGGENDEALGYHLEQAHQYRSELGQFDEHTAILGHRAATRLATAGRRALDRDDLPAAAGLLDRALARTGGDDPERAGLLIDRCEALLSTGAVVDGGLAVAELEALADGSPRLRAWATCFAAQLAILTDPGHLQETAALVEHAAVELAKLTDAAGAAKAHAVHASALARLGRVAETEAALDRALAAAREAGDTRRATGVLAGAPVAALWGPSPVARASGRCLDVVRVLRITTSATTVEATSLRCQAVLEALRGRTDAARRMLSSARRSLEELGHRHGLLSTDMFSGLVELLADDPAAAEAALQRAHEGFLELGAGADAGQAAALLGRAVMAQGRTAEAEQLTVESERLGGADLKTAIAWRAVRAEALARRGAIDDALALARAAVALAEPTDALLDQADTHLAMATILQLAGRPNEAGVSAARAVDLYDRKGATVPAERAARLTRDEFVGAEELPEDVAAFQELTVDAPRRAQPKPTAATHAMDELIRVVLARDWEGVRTRVAPDIEWIDRRGTLGVHVTDPGTYLENLRAIVSLGVTAMDATVLATRGEQHQLARIVFHGETPDGDRGEVAILQVNEFAPDGRIRYSSDFEPGDQAAAIAHLDERYVASLPTREADVVSTGLRFVRSYNERNWDEHFGLLGEAFFSDDHRPAGQGRLERDAFEDLVHGLVDVAPDARIELLEVPEVTTAGFVGVTMLAGAGDVVGPSELLRAQLVLVDDGRITRFEHWPAEEVDAAVASLHGAAPTSSAAPAALSNAATQAIVEGHRLLLAGDWDVLEQTCSPSFRLVDRRTFTQFSANGVDEFMAVSQSIREAGTTEIVHVPIAIRGDRLQLSRTRFSGGPADTENEVLALSLSEIDTSGRHLSLTMFESAQLHDAFAELDTRYGAGEGSHHPSVALAARAIDSWRNGAWDDLRRQFRDDAVVVDHRAVGWGTVDVDAFVARSAAYPTLAADIALYATSVPRAVEHAWLGTMWGSGRTSDGGDIELVFVMLMVFSDERITRLETFDGNDLDAALRRFEEVTTILVLNEVDSDGLVLADIAFDLNDVDAAVAELDRRFAVGEQRAPGWRVATNRAWAVSEQVIESWLAHDWERHASLYSRSATWEDRRPGLQASLRGRHQITSLSKVASGVTATTRTLVATRGERLSLGHAVLVGDDPARGTFEVETLQVVEVDDGDEVIAILQLDPSDIETAHDELDARFAEGEAGGCANTWDEMRRVVRSYNSGDRTFFTDDRFLGRGDRMTCLAVPRISPRGIVAVLRTGGGNSESVFAVVGSISGAHADHLEFFDPERLDAAIARFDELTS